MNLLLIVQPEAEKDMREARQWYDEQREGLGDEFLDAVDVVFERIRQLPLAHAEVQQGVRRSNVRRFPYAVFYRPEEERVVVFAVMHSSRDPERWQSRV